MAAHAGMSVPRSWGLRTRLKAFTGRMELDRRLAERLVIDAVAPPQAAGAAVPAEREAVLAAQHDPLRLVRALRSAPAPPVRGISMVSILLTDGSGPLFAPHPIGTLVELAFQAAFHAEAG
jgi:hypothetical protein